MGPTPGYPDGIYLYVMRNVQTGQPSIRRLTGAGRGPLVARLSEPLLRCPLLHAERRYARQHGG